MRKFLLFIFILVIVLLILFKQPFFKTEKPISYLSYNDLVSLSGSKQSKRGLLSKLEKQLTVPYIFNKRNILEEISWSHQYLRLAHWNIARGYKVDQIKSILTKSLPLSNKELQDFTGSDIISLNEVDIGLPRTQYKNIISELADSINYNYVFATEFVELSPILYKQAVDPKRFLGLHGNAILSRYPIKNVRVLRLPECYKWYETEILRKSPLEYGRRFGAKNVFKVQINNEPRLGGRNAIITDIELPSKEIITVASVHLEDRCYPACRLKQVKYLLENIKYLRRPVVIAGDFNTSTTDTSPTSVRKEIVKRLKDPYFIARQFALALIPGFQFGVGTLASTAIRGALHYKDPTALNIPVLFPNQERELFLYLKDFRFSDGEGFDFGGDRDSNGKGGLLANSNERQLKGFESTFRLAKPMGIAYYKLDWFFVKPKRGRFIPFNGQTLKLVNEACGNRISDHDPITVDLSL